MGIIRIVLCDDHEIVRNGIKMMLETENDLQVVGEGSNGLEAIKLVNELKPDLLIMDISMPEMNGIEATGELIKAKTSSKIMILSMFDREEYVLKAVELGAHGYLLKDSGKDKFLKAIHTIVETNDKYFSSEISNIIVNQYLSKVGGDGGQAPIEGGAKSKSDLTKRENEILTLIVNGFNNKKIAEEYGISVRTIETHRLNIMKKLKVNNAAELVRVAIANNLVELSK